MKIPLSINVTDIDNRIVNLRHVLKMQKEIITEIIQINKS